MVVILLIALLFNRALSGNKFPRIKQAWLHFISSLDTFISDIFGDKGRARFFLPVLASIFTFVLFGNLFGLLFDYINFGVPSLHAYLRPINSDLNTTLVLGMGVVISAQIVAIIRKGFFHHFWHYLFNYSGEMLIEKIINETWKSTSWTLSTISSQIETWKEAIETAKIELGGKVYEFHVVEGTENEKAIDISKLRDTTGYVTLDTGYKNTGATKSSITFLDGELGILHYRGYPIEQLAEKATFIEVAYLLIYGTPCCAPSGFYIYDIIQYLFKRSICSRRAPLKSCEWSTFWHLKSTSSWFFLRESFCFLFFLY